MLMDGILGLQGNPLAISNVASSIIVYVRVHVWGTSAERGDPSANAACPTTSLLHCTT